MKIQDSSRCSEWHHSSVCSPV